MSKKRKRDQKTFSVHKFICDGEETEESDVNLEQKISSIILSLEDEDFNLKPISEVYEKLEEISVPKQLELYDKLVNDEKQNEISNVSIQIPSLWKEIDVKNDLVWFLPHTKKCLIKVEKMFKKFGLYESISKTEIKNSFKFKPDFHKNKKKKSKMKKETKRKPCIKKEEKNEIKNLKSKAKQIKTKKRGKRKHVMTTEEMREKVTNTTFKYTCSNKFMTKKCQKVSRENFFSLVHNPPKLKSILITKKTQKDHEKKSLLKPHRKVSFCSSIFIRNFQVDSESDDDY